jgi:hypothetical protein
MKGTKNDAQKALSAAAAAQRLARLLPNDVVSTLKTSDQSVLEEALLLSACRNTTLRGAPSSHPLTTGSSRVPRFVCCRLNCESTEHRLYRSSISGAVQGVLDGDTPSLEEAQKDEEFVAGWLQTNTSAANASVTAQHKHVEDAAWSNRSQCLHRLEARLNQLLQVYCGRYSDADASLSSSHCGASAFVSQLKRRAGKDAEVDHASLQVDIVLLYLSAAPRRDDRTPSLFDEGWEDAAQAASSTSTNSFSTHHELELQFFSAKNTMVLNHRYEVRLISAPLHNCAPNMTARHSWSVKDHRRPESHAYQDQQMLSTAQSKESLDPINTMQVDRVAESILNAMQHAEVLAVQDAVDSKIPYVVKQAFAPPARILPANSHRPAGSSDL